MLKTRPRSGWDAVVRFSHWTVALLFFLNYFVTEEGEWQHRYIGYAVVALIGIRLLWGLTFSRGCNRLASFVPRFSALGGHWRELRERHVPDEVGHNPAAAFAVYALWLGLTAAAFTGWLSETDWGIDNDVSDVHEWLVEAVFVLVLIHVAAALLMSWWQRRNLVLAMLRGKW